MAASIRFPIANGAALGADVYRASVIDFTPSTSYPALGEPITAAQLGLVRILALYATVADGSRLATYDAANGLIRIWTAISTEAGTGTDQSAKVLRVTAIGV